MHFEPDMWEKTREDGTRKLKWNAIPTIFSFSQPKPTRKPPTERYRLTQPTLNVKQVTPQKSINPVVDVNLFEEKDLETNVNYRTQTEETSISDLKDKAYKKLLLENQKLRNEKRVLKRKYENELKRTEDLIEKKYKKMIKIFNKDQIQALERKNM